MIGPTHIGTLGPVLVAILPNRGERKNNSRDVGVVANPAASGE
jgi:hypothetical protein